MQLVHPEGPGPDEEVLAAPSTQKMVRIPIAQAVDGEEEAHVGGGGTNAHAVGGGAEDDVGGGDDEPRVIAEAMSGWFGLRFWTIFWLVFYVVAAGGITASFVVGAGGLVIFLVLDRCSRCSSIGPGRIFHS